MQVSVELFTFPSVQLAPGAQVRFRHWLVDANGRSLFDPDRWFAMSGAPDLSDVRVDRPAAERAVELVAEGGHRPAAALPEQIEYDWYTDWRNPGSSFVSFAPRLLMAPGR